MIQTIWNTEFYDPKKTPTRSLASLSETRRLTFEQVAAGKSTSRQVAEALGIKQPIARKHLLALARDKYLTKTTVPGGMSNVQEYRVAA